MGWLQLVMLPEGAILNVIRQEVLTRVSRVGDKVLVGNSIFEYKVMSETITMEIGIKASWVGDGVYLILIGVEIKLKTQLGAFTEVC